MSTRRTHNAARSTVIGWMMLIIAAGIACRLAPLGLDPIMRKWGGSALWGALFLCLAALMLPEQPRHRIVAFACLGACLSECHKLVHIWPLDALRATAPGRFVLGLHFAWADLGAYLIGIVAVMPMIIGTHKKE